MSSANRRRNRRNNKRNNQVKKQRNENQDHGADRNVSERLDRWSTETKASYKTTELIVYTGAVLAVIMTALAINENDQGGSDPFGAEHALRYITFLTIGYMIARGLAKAGSHEGYASHNTNDADVDVDLDDSHDTDTTRPHETHHGDAQDDDDRDTEVDVTDADHTRAHKAGQVTRTD